MPQIATVASYSDPGRARAAICDVEPYERVDTVSVSLCKRRARYSCAMRSTGPLRHLEDEMNGNHSIGDHPPLLSQASGGVQ
jgi:hypothetical protein